MHSVVELTEEYFNQQVQRTLTVLHRIGERSEIKAGRVVPSSDDLVIHTGRRIDATVMFLDINGFSKRSSWTEEEQDSLLRLLALFFTETVRIVEDFGGVVEKNTGDGLMAYFVASTEDKIPVQQKAVAAALTMFSAASYIINPIIIRSGMLPIDFRICIDHGPITIARVGSPRGFNGIVAVGSIANVASKMLEDADANTILLGNSMLAGLPTEWRLSWIKLKKVDTGWVFRETGQPYPFWVYEGRWRLPK